MSFKIVRNDITKMHTEAIVNTANDHPTVGSGCDHAVYEAAGYDELLAYRTEKIGFIPEGKAFITPGFHLSAKYIIHAVSPLYMGGNEGEEDKLRSCYRESLRLAEEHGIKSIAFPLISTGGFGYPKEEGLRIAVDEIYAFLLQHEMEIYLVVFDEKATSLGGKIYPNLEEYINRNYVENRYGEEYGDGYLRSAAAADSGAMKFFSRERMMERIRRRGQAAFGVGAAPILKPPAMRAPQPSAMKAPQPSALPPTAAEAEDADFLDFEGEHGSKLEERMRHMSDTFSQYLMYLIQDKKLENAEVYKRAIVDKKIFSKIKNDADYHPRKLTALCLCVGAKLNLDESKDLLARAGYALAPCDKTDIIFSYFIENEIYDMIELDIQLEEHGLPCIIT